MKKNLIAGVASSVWAALIGLAVVPFYLRYLGVEAYGLIGFFAMLQALLQMLDLGLTSAINREIARNSTLNKIDEVRSLLHTLAVVYWTMALAIALLVIAISPLIAAYWLQPKQLSQDSVTHAVMLMGLVVACRWPSGLYQGALIGMQRQAISSMVNIVIVSLGSLGAVGVLAFVSPSIEAFFIWQACAALLGAFAMRWSAWEVLGRKGSIKIEIESLKKIWRFSMGMSGVALTSIVFTQMDKVILSKILGLTEFGYYMLATVVVSGLYVLISPLFNIVYPRFSALVASDEIEKLVKIYRLSTRLLATVLFPLAMILALFSSELVSIWTGSADIAVSVSPLIELLVVGTALNGVMYFPYALQLAYGMTWIPLIINMVLMVILVPLTVFLAWHLGALGGALSWAILEVLYLLFGTALTHRYLLKKMGLVWLIQDVGIPMGLTLLVATAGKVAIQWLEIEGLDKAILGICMAILASLMSVILSAELRHRALQYLGGKSHVVGL